MKYSFKMIATYKGELCHNNFTLGKINVNFYKKKYLKSKSLF